MRDQRRCARLVRGVGAVELDVQPGASRMAAAALGGEARRSQAVARRHPDGDGAHPDSDVEWHKLTVFGGQPEVEVEDGAEAKVVLP